MGVFKMTRFFFILIITLTAVIMAVLPVMGMGVSDFVAVADGPASFIYNPAALASFDAKQLYLEHRIDGRDQAVGWDDILFYTVPGSGGAGALFATFSQDLEALDLYDRFTTYGYAFGWQSSDRISVGLAAKFSYWGIFDDSSGLMLKIASSNNFLLDAGVLIKASQKLQMGFALHNIGRSDDVGILNYQSTAGVAIVGSRWVIAAEIYDFLNEGGYPLEGAIIRAGGRLDIGRLIRLHLVVESSDWDYLSQQAALELRMKSGLTLGVSYWHIESPLIDGNTWQAGLGYRF
jgi:hypothetical protein